MAVAVLPDLPPVVHTIAIITSAFGVGALGKLSKDCPPNCPGTDELGRPRTTPPAPTPLLPGLSALFVLCAALALPLVNGCTVVHANTTRATDPATGIVSEKATINGWTLLDSSQALARASAHSSSATNGTWAPGISMTGLNQTSSSTGLVVIVNAILPAAVAAAAK